MSDSQGPELQRDVQRLMGRCLLRLQQYERLMKVLLAHQELGGPAQELHARQAARLEKFADRSLGQLVKSLFESYVITEGDQRSDQDTANAPADRVSMTTRFQLQMSEEQRTEVRSAIEELVQMRNELVHHLIERFDVWTDDGCRGAVEHLQHCYDRIDRHFLELRHWANAMKEASVAMVSFAQSEVFLDFVIDGIAPDGAIDWPHAGIVRVLRDAVRANSADGWLRLDDARVWIAEHHPEQVPERYGCRTWPQVLSESREFRVEYRQEAGRKFAWFRAHRELG